MQKHLFKRKRGAVTSAIGFKMSFCCWELLRRAAVGTVRLISSPCSGKGESWLSGSRAEQPQVTLQGCLPGHTGCQLSFCPVLKRERDVWAHVWDWQSVGTGQLGLQRTAVLLTRQRLIQCYHNDFLWVFCCYLFGCIPKIRVALATCSLQDSPTPPAWMGPTNSSQVLGSLSQPHTQAT